ncbi:LysM peptidoglycan-binding domain-containing protein [Paenimyroides tangerinum]|uniref:LysM peptidoglycan-binding domain-containing protein n=1 Tax=Paenimyroides tangerinum TaxID=2488728 RepID=A0A3P3WCY9_9FLAO|nr:LysM peptidoglycan-binding domain-containing protein [Paenimyroides tangerinum]RRJ91499.1 LysM peptidoglycan-binding domain-containing protein [Paenimyroides tangerinum]
MKNKIGTLFLLMFTSAVSFAQEATQKHTVQKGETITQIAKKYQTSANEIFLLNPNAVNGINENQILLIPNLNSGAIQHEVLAQETIYGISKKYNIAIDQLYLYNPGLKENGLKIGQKINISKPKTVSNTTSNSSESKVVTYREIEVKEKETIYSLANQNNTTVSEIYELNPKLESDGLKKGQIIKIPSSKKKTESNNPTYATSSKVNFIFVEPKETIFGISKKYNVSKDDLMTWNPDLQNGLKEGMKLYVQKPLPEIAAVLEIIEDEPIVEKIKINKSKNQVQELTFLLPFNINEDSFSDRAALNKRLNTDVFLNMSLDFYSGALIAIDSAKAMNLPIHIKIVDSKENNRSLNIEELKSQIDFSSTDVVIGPFFQKNVDAFSEVFKNQDLMVVSPLSTDTGKPYPNQVHAMPNNGMIRNTMMEYLRSNYGNLVAVVNPKSNSNKAFFTQNYSEVKLVNTSDNGSLSASSIESELIQGKVNYVILDSNSMKTAIDLITSLKKLKSKFDIRLVALEKLDVLDSTEVQIQDLVDLKFTFPSVTNDATSNVNVKFEEAFKKRFNTSPNRFAIRGFDVTMDVISRMMQDDDNGENIFGYGSEQIENKFTYVNENGGIFNSGIYVLYYDKDLTIKEAQ